MTDKQLVRAVTRLVQKWLPILLGKGVWTVSVQSLPGSAMMASEYSDRLGSVPPFMSTTASLGERKILIQVNNEKQWGSFWADLEVSTIHELLHTVIRDMGFDQAVAALRKVAEHRAPAEADVCVERVQETEEELLDRLAVILTKGVHHGA